MRRIKYLGMRRQGNGKNGRLRELRSEGVELEENIEGEMKRRSEGTQINGE